MAILAVTVTGWTAVPPPTFSTLPAVQVRLNRQGYIGVCRSRAEIRFDSQDRCHFAPKFCVIVASSADNADRLLPIVVQLRYFRVKDRFLSMTFCHHCLCFHTHSRVDLHF